MRLNKTKRRRNVPLTHEGAPAYPEVGPEQQLARSVLSCLLWEDTFYESGQTIADRISTLAREVRPSYLSKLAIKARKQYKLRHAPLLLLDALCETGPGTSLVQDTVYETIDRADEISEMLAIYWRDGKRPISNQLKKGLARAFTKFDAHQLAKYNRQTKVTLRDVMFMVHPKPLGPLGRELKRVFDEIAAKETRVTGTWEAELSAGSHKKTKRDKREVWERKLESGKLGYMALLRNLRNMTEAGVDRELVSAAIVARRGAHKVLPFRFVAALNAAPQYKDELDLAFAKQISEIEADDERTVVLVDVSYSMFGERLSAKSDMDRIDAAATLALMVPGKRRIFAFSNNVKEVRNARGLKDLNKIKHAVNNGGTYIGGAIEHINQNVPHDRLIVITDEQSHDEIGDPRKRGYMINVASYKNGVGYGRWVHIDGFSEQVLRFIAAYETEGYATV